MNNLTKEQRQQLLNQIPVSTTAIIQGNVAYSRISKMIEGAELAAANQRAMSVGRMAVTVPYTTITIENPQIITDNQDMRTYLEHRLFLSKETNSYRFGMDSRSPFPPRVGHLNQSENKVYEISLEGELAVGSSVQLLVSIFYSKRYSKNSLGLEGVTILDPEIRYFQGAGSIAQTMAAAGMTWIPKADKQPANGSTEVAPSQAPANNQAQGFAPNPTQGMQQYQPNQGMSQYLPNQGMQQYQPTQSMPQYQPNQYTPPAEAINNATSQPNSNFTDPPAPFTPGISIPA